MKINKLHKLLLFLGFLGAAACSKWTSVESIKLNEGSFSEMYPEAYESYLQHLRNFKNSDHLITVAKYNNSYKDTPASRADHISDLPDSIDYVILNDAHLSEIQKKDIMTLRKDKGTKVLLEISYNSVAELYAAKLSEDQTEYSFKDDSLFRDTYSSYIENTLAAYSDEYFDGISISYNPNNAKHLDSLSASYENSRQEQFINDIAKWEKSCPSGIMFFDGEITFLSDKSLLQRCKYIICDASGVNTINGFDIAVGKNIYPGVATNKFLLKVNTKSLDKEDIETGYVNDIYGNRISAIKCAAEWTYIPNTGFCKCGIVVSDAKNDYYNSTLNYSEIKKAINIMNPSPIK